MLEQIALSISTALFFLCTAVVGSVLPSPPADAAAPIESTVSVQAAVNPADEFSIIGQWNSGGRILEFTRSGKLIFAGTTMSYSLTSNLLSLTADINGSQKSYTLPLEIISPRQINLNGISMYKIS